MEECPSCGLSIFSPNTRLIKDTCGHLKCRLCLLKEEKGCRICHYEMSRIPEEIQLDSPSLPNAKTKNLNSTIKKVIREIPVDNQYPESPDAEPQLVIDEERILEEQSECFNEKFKNNETTNSDYLNHLSYTNIIMTENEIAKDQTEIQNKEEIYKQVIETPSHFDFYKSPEFQMSDYLLFNNPYAQDQNQKSPDSRLSNFNTEYLLPKSPHKANNFNHSLNSPFQSPNNRSPNVSLSECITFTTEPILNNNLVRKVEVVQMEKSSDFELNNNPELTELKNYAVLDDISKEKEHVIEDIMTENEQINYNNKEISNQSSSIVIVLQDDDEEKKQINSRKISESTDEDKENKERFYSLSKSKGLSKIEDTCNILDENEKKENDTSKKSKGTNKIVEKRVDKNINKEKPTNFNTKYDKIKEINSPNNKKKTRRKKRSTVTTNKKTNGEDPPKRRRLNRDWRHIETIPGDPVTYKCTICQKIFNNFRYKTHHTACLFRETPFSCEICDRNFNKRSHFEYHMRVHNGERPFQCTLCPKNFIQKDKLQRHLTSVHNQNYDVECADCGKTFKSKEYLKAHLLAHKMKNAFKCRLCPKTFTIDYNRKRHELAHSSDKPYKCNVCSNSFKYNFLLTRHKKIHENSRPFSCDICKRIFMTKAEIQRHITIHSAAKPHKCKECGLKFRRKDNLKRHILHHHTEDAISQPATPQVVTKSPSRKSENKPNKTPRQNSSLSAKSSTSLSSKESSRNRDSNNAESLIKKPIRIKHITVINNKTERIKLGVTKPMSLEEAHNINRRIEENLHSQGSCDFPGLSRVTRLSFNNKQDVFGAHADSNDETSILCKRNQEMSKTGNVSKNEKNDTQNCETSKTNPHKHWRRRITESLKCLDV